MPLVGRARELALVHRALRECAGGRAGIVEVSGEPGIGKSRLLAELAAAARADGHTVLASRAGGRYGVFDELLGLVSRGRRTGPAGSPLPSGPARGETPFPPGVPALCHLLEQAATAAPLTLVVDDLHLADEATIALLGPLLRQPVAGRVLLAVGHRPRQAPPRLLAALAEADPGWALRLELGELSQADADRLLRGLDRPHREACHRAGGGNPSYLLALAQLDAAGVLGAPVLAGIAPPRRWALTAEFAGLGQGTVRVACAAAVAGQRFDPELVMAIAATGSGGWEAGPGAQAPYPELDELLARDLLRPAERGELRFRHWLVRLAAYQLAGATWRREAHRRAAGELRLRGASLATRAVHVECYAVAGDTTAVEELTGAARAELMRAPTDAARWLRAALTLLPDHGRPTAAAGERRQLQFELALASGLAGDLVESRRVLHGVLPEPDHSRRPGAVAFCAMVERLLGHHAESRELLLRELGRQRGRPGSRAELELELAIGALMRGDLAENGRWARTALIAAGAGSAAGPANRGIQATALGFLAMASYSAADVGAAFAHLREAAGLVDAMTDRELTRQLPATLWLAWNEVYFERYHEAVRHLDRGLRLAGATGQRHLLPLMLTCRGLALRWLGQLPAAADSAERSVVAATETGSNDLRAVTLAVRSWIASWTGDRAAALESGAAAVRAVTGRSGWFAALATAMLARSRLMAGDPAGVAAAISTALGGPELTAVDPRSRISWWEVLVRAELAEGDLAAAAAYAGRAELMASRIDLPGHRGLAALARAHVLAAAGDPASASRALASATAFAQAGCPLEEARARMLAATALATAGPAAGSAAGSAVGSAADPATGPAAEQLRRARALFDACGARSMARLAARLLDGGVNVDAGRNGSGPPVPPAVLASLTPRERQAAMLVADGLSNREIGRRLGISGKTVEKHVSRVMAKLATGSRAGVAGLVGRTQIRPRPDAPAQSAQQ